MRNCQPSEATGALPDEMGVLYDRYAPAAYRMALHRVRDPDLAADVVQEAFLSLWRARHSYRPERGAVGALLCTLVHRRAVELLRRRAAWPATQPWDHQLADMLVDEAPGPDQVACDRDAQRRVLEAMQQLPPLKSHALQLTWLGGYRASELAAIMDVPLSTAKGRVLSARSQLRGLLPREAVD
jgi:RNA polymerase sigma-70 factor (ECF subfamily)